MRVGRLAPSPTGSLHLGNLSSSVLAWLQARKFGGRLLYRIEDLDPPRVVAGAAEEHQRDLRWLGLDWDEGPESDPELFVQSLRSNSYQRAIERLAADGHVYPCTCSRKDIQRALSAPHMGEERPDNAYPGTCAHRQGLHLSAGDDRPFAIRMRARGTLRIDDQLQGVHHFDLQRSPGDFVLRRKDGLFAYQLAVVVDDLAAGVTDVVRGYDLLESAPRQSLLCSALGGTPPTYWHAPLLLDESGERLSKRRGSADLRALEAAGLGATDVLGILALIWGWQSTASPLGLDDLLSLWNPTTLAVPHLCVSGTLLPTRAGIL